MYEVEENLIDGALYAVRKIGEEDTPVRCGRFVGKHVEGSSGRYHRQRKYGHFRLCDDTGQPVSGDEMFVVTLPYAVMYSWDDWLHIRRATTALGVDPVPKTSALGSKYRWQVTEDDMLRIGRQLKDGGLPTA